MSDSFQRYGMKKPPVPTKWYLRPITWIISAPAVWTMVHDMNGFRVKCTDADDNEHEMTRTAQGLYSCHIEYDYLGKYGDCVDLNTLEDTWYIYPHDCEFSVTKMALATEELYFAYRRSIGRLCKPGLA